MENNNFMRIYWMAAVDIFGKKEAEKWLDNNGHKLSKNIKTLKEAKIEINNNL